MVTESMFRKSTDLGRCASGRLLKRKKGLLSTIADGNLNCRNLYARIDLVYFITASTQVNLTGHIIFGTSRRVWL